MLHSPSSFVEWISRLVISNYFKEHVLNSLPKLYLLYALTDAHVIVLGTPVYFYAMSAQLKTFLDRCCGLYTEMKNKEFYFISASAEGEDDRQNLERVFENLMGFIDCLDNPIVSGKILATGVWHVGEIKGNPALAEAYEMGKQIG